jgi:hypothetical protein
MAILLSNKFPGMSYEEGHCFNDAHCGCRFWGKGYLKESLTYASFEKVDGDFLPIMVHPNLRHVTNTYGGNGTSFISSTIVNTPFLPHDRVKKVFMKAFKSYEDEEEIELLFQQAEERGGGGHISQASKGGGFEERISWCLRHQQWKIRVNFFNRTSITKAINDKLITKKWEKKPNQRKNTKKIIRENMNNRGEFFIPWSRGGWITGYEKTGTLIKFSGYVHTRRGGSWSNVSIGIDLGLPYFIFSLK